VERLSLNVIFLAIVLIAFVAAAVRQVLWVPEVPDAPSPMEVLTTGAIEAAGGAVTLAIGLVGVMALFLGLMKVAEEGGLLVIIAKTVRPLMVRLFPEVPADHPAMGAMILNISANALGLGNAATPFGIRAMQELDKLNTEKGTATNAMALFLAINTSSVTLLPTGVVALRASLGSTDPAGIVPTTLFATICSTTVAILTAKFCQRFWAQPVGTAENDEKMGTVPIFSEAGGARGEDAEKLGTKMGTVPIFPEAGAGGAYPTWVSFLVLAAIAALVPLTVAYGKAIAPWIVPGLIVGLLGFGALRRVRVYEVLVEGAKDGFQVALRIIPYLVAILVAVGMFRASGAMDVLVGALGRVTGLVGLPAEALPMALLRPLSGSGAYGIMAAILQDPAVGPDSYTGYLVSTLQGSTETTFYVLAVYFGAVQIRRIRHALVAGLSADLAGTGAAFELGSLESFVAPQTPGGRLRSLGFARPFDTLRVRRRARPRRRPGAATARRALPALFDQTQVVGRGASVPSGRNLELDLLAFGKTTQAGALHCRDVNENVLRAIVRGDEAEALGRVEPLDGSGNHMGSLLEGVVLGRVEWVRVRLKRVRRSNAGVGARRQSP
jgi:spore maturation protein SpmA/spore maturation protein SpmB